MFTSILIRLGVVLAAAAAIAGFTFAKTRNYYLGQEATREKVAAVAAVRAQDKANETKAENEAASEKVNDEAKIQLATMGAHIADLTSRLQHSPRSSPNSVPSASPSPPVADAANGPGIESSDRCLAPVAPADVAAGLAIGEDALRALLLWREYARDTHQAK